MSVRDVFSNRFTLLRSVHRNTYKDLSRILGINSNAVNEWATSRRNFPGPEMLMALANIYAVSVDWLMGRKDSLYDGEVLLRIEENFVIGFLSTMFNSASVLPSEYVNPELREKNYTLAVRANIVTLAFTTYYSAFEIIFGKDAVKSFDVNKGMSLEEGIELGRKMVELDVKQGNLLNRLVFMEKREPAFDVEGVFYASLSSK